MASVYLRLEPARPGTGAPAEQAGAARRHAGLERLLAAAQAPETIADWRLDAQRLLQLPGAELLSAAPVAWCGAMATATGDASAGLAPGAQVFLAQALHTEATLSSVRLPAYGLLQLDAGERRELAEDFDTLPALPAAGGAAAPRLLAAGEHLFYCFDGAIDAHSPDPATLLGFDMREFRPGGAHASRLAALGSEVEMWLFEHRLNRARRERGAPVITTLWPWGGGVARAELPPPGFTLLGDDVLFGAWARRSPPAAQAQDSLIICPQSVDPAALDALLAPRLPALRAARGALHISAGRRRFTVRRMPRRWFAHRTGPWWELFDESD